jgi:hypothetical protein
MNYAVKGRKHYLPPKLGDGITSESPLRVTNLASMSASAIYRSLRVGRTANFWMATNERRILRYGRYHRAIPTSTNNVILRKY